MHHLGPFSLAPDFEGPELDFGSKNCQNASQGKPCTCLKVYFAACLILVSLGDHFVILHQPSVVSVY